MGRTIMIATVLMTIAAAAALYVETYGTRRLEAEVQAAERRLERLEADISVLRAERAHLAKPQRIEPLARALGLRPLEPGQIAVRAPGEALPLPTAGPR